MFTTKKMSLIAMLIMVMLVAAACGDKAKESSSAEEKVQTENAAKTDNAANDDAKKEAANNETADDEAGESKETSAEASTDEDKTKNVELGTTEKGSYTNDYFGVSLKFPETWEFQDAAGMNELTNASSEAIAGDDATKKKQMELSMQKTLNLLMASELPLGGQEVGPSAMAIAEKVSLLQGIRNGKDYLEATKKFMQDSQFPYEYDDITTETIGGKEMDLMKITMDAGNGTTITQEYYSTILEGYAFNFIFTYLDDKSKATIDEIKQSVQFK